MRLARLLAAAALLPALSGCVAAVAPLLAGTLVGREAVDRPDPQPSKTPVVEVVAKPGVPSPDVGLAAAVTPTPLATTEPGPAPGPAPAPAPSLAPIAVTPLPEPAELAAAAPGGRSPAPELPAAVEPAAPVSTVAPPRASFSLRTEVEAPGQGSFAAFARFATVRAAPALAGKPRQSALIDPATLTALPRAGACTSQRPAVAIDIDPGARAFDLDDPPLPAEGLAQALADLRMGGLSILWVSSLTTDKEGRLRTILQATGLDPERADRVLLRRKDKDRKTTRLRDAAGDWCIVAIAGDQRGDFEEAYDYLKDPDGPIARTLDTNLGNGWFITPLPIQ